MGKLIPIAIVLLTAAGGAGAGFVMRPAPPIEETTAAPVPAPSDPARPGLESAVTLRDTFVVPVLRDGHVWSYAVLTLGVISDTLDSEQILLREPLIRDGLMEALFLHGSLGGFDDDFTQPQAMIRLRRRLDDMIERRLADPTARILIESLARQGV